MKNGSPDFQVKFSAKDDGTFGATIRKVKADLAEVSKQLAAGVTGGIIGGGSVGAILAVVDKVSRLVSETLKLASIARNLNLPFKQVRGISASADFVGADSNAVTDAMDRLTRRREDALAGEPEAIKSFERLGLSLEKIKNLGADELFFAVADSFKKVKMDAPRTVAAVDLLGGANSNELLPFFNMVGGSAFRPTDSQKSGLGAYFSGPAGAALRGVYSIFGKGNPFAANMDPVSTFPIEREAQASRLATQNRDRAIDLLRSQLPLEQQLTQALAERLKIENELGTVKDPIRRERLVGRLLDLDATILGARNAQMSAPTGATGATWTRNLDEMSRAGIFTGGSPSLFIDLAKQQLSEARKQTDLLRTNPAEIAKSL